MHRHLDNELKELNAKLLVMAAMASNAIAKAINSLKQLDISIAQEVIDNDQSIDNLELIIEEMCINILCLQQPQASDLRFVTNANKINADLERIADLAVDIAERVLELVDKPLLKPLVDIPKLTDVAQSMVKDVINAFIDRDAKLAKTIIMRDQEADELRNKVQKELIYDYMAKDAKTAPRAVPLLLIARYLERICDHATNIAEDIIYMVKAEIIKHHPEKL
jgi:phosphate transport system protein